MEGKLDILEFWYQNAFAYSSSFSINPLYDRRVVDFIHNFLTDFFPRKYFLIDQENKPKSKSNIIIRCLRIPNSTASVLALLEYCASIKYAVKDNEEIRSRIFHLFKSSPGDLNSYLFELYIHMVLSDSNLPYLNSAMHEGKERDGLVTIGDTQYIVECKRPIFPQAAAYDHAVRIFETFQEILRDIQASQGFKIHIRFKQGDKLDGLSIWRKNLTDAFQSFQESGGRFESNIDLSKLDISTSIYKDWMEPVVVDETDSRANIVIEGKTINYIAGHSNIMPVTSEFKHQVSREKVIKKIIQTIKSCNKQHKSTHKIIFIDNQVLPDIEIPILPIESMFDDISLDKYIKESSQSFVVVLVSRSYSKLGIQETYRMKGSNFSKKHVEILHDAIRTQSNQSVLNLIS